MDTYNFMNATQETVDVGRNWLVNMGEAADANGINIQYCLTLTRCGLQALEIPRVTQARVSADYSYNFAQWTIGLTGLITDQLGIAPHKGHNKPLVQNDRTDFFLNLTSFKTSF